MAIRFLDSPADLRLCYPVMAQLRPHLHLQEFVTRAQQQFSGGYQLAALFDENEVCAVAGFRFLENLAWDKFLYVDDLVVDQHRRSRGYGKRLLDWLMEQAHNHGCAQLHLDSGVQRKDAHRFYLREGLQQSSLHFHCLPGK